jgi:DNA-binding transcriptional ArsR family regulator
MSPSSQPTLWRTCRVLANRKRLQTLALLIRQPNQTVSAVAERMSLSVPTASQYLRALEARGLLTCRRAGRRVEYRPSAGMSEGAAEEMVKALRLVFRRRAQPIEAIFKLATGFTHPRRVEVFRALANGADSLPKLPSGDRYAGASALPASREIGGKRLCEERDGRMRGPDPTASIRSCLSAFGAPLNHQSYFAKYGDKRVVTQLTLISN